MDLKKIIIIGTVVLVLAGASITAFTLLHKQQDEAESSSSEPVLTIEPSSDASSSSSFEALSEKGFTADDVKEVLSDIAKEEGFSDDEVIPIANALAIQLPNDWDKSKDKLIVQEASINEKDGFGYAQVYDEAADATYIFNKINGEWKLTREISGRSAIPDTKESSSSSSSSSSSASYEPAKEDEKEDAPASSSETKTDEASVNTQDQYHEELFNYSGKAIDINSIVSLSDEKISQYMSTDDIDSVLLGVNGYLGEYGVSPVSEGSIFVETKSITKDSAGRPIYKLLVSHTGGQSVFQATCDPQGVYIDLVESKNEG